MPITVAKSYTNTTSPKWFSKSVKQATNQKYKAYCKLRTSPLNLDLKLQYKLACKQVKSLVKKTILKYESNLINRCKFSPKLLYTYINDQKSCNEHIRELTKRDGTSSFDMNEIVEILNQQFCDVFNPTIIYPCKNPDQQKITHTCEVSLEIFSSNKILKSIRELNAHKSASHDGIHLMVLKKCPEAFAKILSEIFKMSLHSRIVPEVWKEANITPILKKGNRTDPANYRPISLTAVPCKIMERSIRDVMMDHLTKNNLIAQEQHGFFMNKSCLKNLLETIDIASYNLDSGNRILLVFLDF